MRNTQRGWMAMVAGGLVLSWGRGVAVAQDEAGPLAGPGIAVRDVPGVAGSFGAGDAGRFGARGQAVPLPVFFAALNSLESDEAGEGLALSIEQLAYVQQEMRAFREELTAFVAVSGDEVRALVGQLPKDERGRAAGAVKKLERMEEMLKRVARSDGFPRSDRAERAGRSRRGRSSESAAERPGHMTDRDDGFRLRFRGLPGEAGNEAEAMMVPMEEGTMAADGSVDARARLMELHAAAPSSAELQTRLWEVLSEPQREVVGAALDAHMAEVQTKREEQRLEKEIERRKGEANDRKPSNRKQGDGERSDKAQGVRGFGIDAAAMDRVLQALDSGEIPQQLWSRLPDRTRQRLESLPEEDRAQALARVLRSRRDGVGQKPTRKRPG